MKKLMRGLKERWNERTVIEQILILWGIFAISLFLDATNCKWMAFIYNCDPEELLYTTEFYILSPIFGIVDLILGWCILKKAVANLKKEVYHIILNFGFKVFEFDIPRGRQFLYSMSATMSMLVIAISVCSLIVDVIKFF